MRREPATYASDSRPNRPLESRAASVTATKIVGSAATGLGPAGLGSEWLIWSHKNTFSKAAAVPRLRRPSTSPPSPPPLPLSGRHRRHRRHRRRRARHGSRD